MKHPECLTGGIAIDALVRQKKNVFCTIDFLLDLLVQKVGHRGEQIYQGPGLQSTESPFHDTL